MEGPTGTVAGHATEARTDRVRRIAVPSGAGMPTETTAVGGTIPATEGVAGMARPIPLPVAVTAAALDPTRPTASAP